MKKKLLYIFAIILFSNLSFGQNKMWKEASEERLVYLEKMERISFPSEFKLFSLNLNEFKQSIASAPIDLSGKYSNTIVGFPDANGNITQYRVYESPIMEVDLANKYPGIKSYTAVGIDDPTARLRFSVTLFGLHSMSLSGNTGTYYIDTYTKDLNNYIVYNRKDIQSTRTFGCLVEDDHEKVQKETLQNKTTFASDGMFRQYRLAMACTIEYAAFHVNSAGLNAGTEAQKKAAVLSAMNVTMTRVNGVFERDVSLRMNLIANNDVIIFITSDNFTNNTASTLINESQVEIDAAIGFANYDIGHTVSTGGGGLAQLNSPCSTSKARGITGSGAPVGDPYDIDYVAHEIGHQWGGTHTQNNSCNRTASTAVEPGSGSTIMAYAGICAPNVQNNSDAHFHAVSIAQMSNFSAGSGNSCALATSSGNFAPVVNAGPDYTIPKGTAFVLKGAATDANGDALTYCWEQTNIEVSTQPPLQTSTSGPNFRSRPPVASPDRYMPRIQDVIANNLAPTWEVVPNVARTMNFALTVRDNRTPNGGQTGRDNTVITTANVGPFLVNSPNTNVSWVAGSNQTVTWTVAGTDSNGINASFVDILLSTDGGTTYTRVLASKVPNDGSEIVTVPNTVGTTNRIMVRGNNHIFYDISNTNFSITAAPSSFSVAFSGVEGTQNSAVCSVTSTNFSINYTALGGFSGTTSFAATGNPAGSTVSFSPTTISATGTVILTVGNLASVPAGDYQIVVSATSGGTTRTVPFYLSVGISPVVLTSPANNAIGQGITTILTWNPNPVATSYDIQVASDIAFNTIVSSGNVVSNSYTVSGLNQATSYYWRVLPKNASCTGVYGTAFKFTTGTVSCSTTVSTNVPIAISTGAASTITSTINIPTVGSISDVNITMNITHTWISDLTATLTSPSGTVVQLFSSLCGSRDNLNATFDDSGSVIVCGNSPAPAISGVVLPSQALSAFNGSNSTGTWTLTISDSFNGDGGALNSWSLNICSVQPIPEINISKDLSSSDIPSGAAANSSYNTIFAPTTLGNNLVNTYYIENEGNANLTIGSVSITGANPGDFSVSTIPAVIPVGATLTNAVAFTVTFTPQAAGIRTATISIANNDSNENPYTFDVEGTGGNCATSTTWTGATNNLWSEATNWSCGVVPTGSTDVIIDTGTPILDIDLTLQSGKTLTLSGTGTLAVASTASLTIQGTTDFGGKSVILKSDATGTATIRQITGTLSNATNVTVERYIPAKRAWRALTAPLKGNNVSLFDTWQNSGTVTPGIGVEIWGPSGTGSSGNGLEVGPNNSVLSYGTGWTGITNTKTTNLFEATKNNAYMVFVTGHYGSGNILSTIPATVSTLKATGSIISGDVVYSGLSSTSHTLIGNPYASPLNPATLLTGATNMNIFWVWDPLLNTLGGYNSFDHTLSAYNTIGGSYPDNTTAIQSGQAFFVKASTGTGSFTLLESKKSNAVSNVFGKNANQNIDHSINASVLRFGLYKENTQGWQIADGAIVGFYDTATNLVDAKDGRKFENGGENIAFVRDNITLSSEHFSIPQPLDELYLRIWNTLSNNYKLRINTESFIIPNIEATLIDLFTGTQTPIALDGSIIEYPFAVTAAAGSTGNRFKIVFSATALATTIIDTKSINVYPNPVTNSILNVQLPKGDYSNYSYELINVLGQKVMQDTIEVLSGYQFSINTKGLASNWYAFRILNGGTAVYQTKVIIVN